MKNRLHILIIILTIGFFLTPGLSYACGTKVEKECCNKEVSSKTATIDCCSNKGSEENDSGCTGKCGHSNCTAPSINLSKIYFNEIEFRINNFDFLNKIKAFYYSETVISSGYTSIWLIPKIS